MTLNLPLDKRDIKYAAVLAVAVVFLHAVYYYPGVYPGIWEPSAIAAGLLPASRMLDGIWIALNDFLIFILGIHGASFMMRVLGVLFAAVDAAAVYFTFRFFLPWLTGVNRLRRIWESRWGRILPAFGAITLMLSDPFWRMGQTFMPSSLQATAFLLSFLAFAGFYFGGPRAWGYASIGISGLFFAHNPLAALPTFFFVLMFCRRLPSVENNELIRIISRRWIFFWFLIGYLGSMIINMITYCAHDGVAVNGFADEGFELGVFIVEYMREWWWSFFGTISPFGWFAALAVGFVPIAVSIAHTVRATDDERLLPYATGWIATAFVIVSFLQLTGFRFAWFWTFNGNVFIGDDVILAFLLFLCAATLVLSFSVLTVEAFYRDYRHIAERLTADFSEDNPNAVEAGARTAGKFVWMVRLLTIGAIFGMCILSYYGITRRSDRAYFAVIRDYIDETVTECGDKDYLFTDGSMDAAIRLESAARGHAIKTLSLISGPHVRERHIREMAAEDEEDKQMLFNGADQVLKSWFIDKTNRLEQSAIQIGFELWTRNKRPMPTCSGLVAFPGTVDSEAVSNGIARTDILAGRVENIAANMPRPVDGSAEHYFPFVQFRLSRLMRMRADALDARGELALATMLSGRADVMDKLNRELTKAMERAPWLAQRLDDGALTPREGLKVALERADFKLARRYAQVILSADPEDTRANFAMGMAYYVEKQYSRAEEHLKRCLIRRPDEPAALNNLAVVQMHLNRLTEAESNAVHAAELLPRSPEIKRTIEQIRRQRNYINRPQ